MKHDATSLPVPQRHTVELAATAARKLTMDGPALRILIVDAHPVMRRGVRSLLETRPRWTICGEAASGRDAVAQAKRLMPDVVVIDLTLPEMDGVEATRQILRDAPGTEVVALTTHDSEGIVQQMLQAGARGYVLKSDAGRSLVDAVDNVARHTPFFTPTVAALVLDGYIRRGAFAESFAAERATVTSREREIIHLIAEGRRSKAVAAALGISVKTVEAHRMNIMRKLQMHSVAQLVRYAIRHHLTEV
jgi:DNA-binding NarL/FixJ family response regulator